MANALKSVLLSLVLVLGMAHSAQAAPPHHRGHYSQPRHYGHHGRYYAPRHHGHDHWGALPLPWSSAVWLEQPSPATRHPRRLRSSSSRRDPPTRLAPEQDVPRLAGWRSRLASNRPGRPRRPHTVFGRHAQRHPGIDGVLIRGSFALTQQALRVFTRGESCRHGDTKQETHSAHRVHFLSSVLFLILVRCSLSPNKELMIINAAPTVMPESATLKAGQ